MTAQIHILRNEADYETAMAEYDSYFDNEADLDDEAGDRFELLGLLLSKYEQDNFPIPPADPVEAILFAMERKGLTQSDLATLLGSRPRASEVLNHKRDLTLPQIKKLSRDWQIPVQALMGEYEMA